MDTRIESGFLIRLIYVVVLSVLLHAQNDLWAQWSKDSSKNNLVVTLDISTQRSPIVVADKARGVIVVWEDNRKLTDFDLYAQRILESGTLAWGGNGAAISNANEDQRAPAIAVTDTGSFFVGWIDNQNEAEIKLRGFGFDGIPVWPGATLAHNGNNSPPRVFFSGSGEIISAAYLSGFFHDVISIQITEGGGNVRLLPNKTIMNAAAEGRQPDRPPAVAPALDGGAVSAWTDTRMDTVVYVIGMHANGNIWEKGEFAVGESVASGTSPAVISDGSFGVLVAWIQKEVGSQNDMVFVTRLNDAGAAAWSLEIAQLPTTFGDKKELRAVSDGDGGAYLMWQNITGGGPRLYVQRVRNNGEFWPLDISLATAVGAQIEAQLAATGTGLVAAWNDDRNGEADIFAQAVNANGSRLWAPEGVTVSNAFDNQTKPSIASDGLGGAIIAWQDSRNGNLDIYAQRVNKNGGLGEFRTVGIINPVLAEEWEIGSARTIEWQASPEIENVKIELSRDGGDTYENLFNILPNQGTRNSRTLQPVDGPPTTLAVLRISAVGPSFIRSVSDTFSIVNPAGPTLVPQELIAAVADSDTTVAVSAIDLSGIGQTTLHYRMGGKPAFETAAMSLSSGDIYQATLPGSAVTERGIEYFITASDVIGNSATTDTFNVFVNFEATKLRKQVTLGSGQVGYRMISSPNFLSETLADSIFAASGFGAYDTTSWRLFEFRDSTYVEHDTSNIDTWNFVPGQAYWLISARTRTVDFGRGTTIPVGQSYPLTLKPGWNQIGNPFAFPISWDEIVVENGQLNVSQPFLYRGTFIRPEMIEPFEGYFIYNYEDFDVTLQIPEREYVETSQLSKTNKGPDWQIRLSSSVREARDEDNFVGIHKQAAAQWDHQDNPEPPPVGESVSLYFPHWDWKKFAMNYTSDFRRDLGPGQTWQFIVRSNVRNAEAWVDFELTDVPDELQVKLLDQKLNISQDLREEASYAFVTGANGVRKELQLVVGRADYVSAAMAEAGLVPSDFELSQNFPNPFNPTTSIRYGLPTDEKVSIRIYDILGREVTRLLQDEQQKAGFHVVNWNARDKSGLPVASGLYIYRLTAGKFTKARKMLLVK